MTSNTTPSWPSLYNPGVEILHITHHPPTNPRGSYLYRAGDIFRFTLYWTLIFYIPLFLVCGFYAFWNYAFPPSPKDIRETNHASVASEHQMSPMLPITQRKRSVQQITRPLKPNERRSRVAFALIVLFTFLTLSLAGAVTGSAILGIVTYGLFKSANFHMSTWIPFLLAVMQVLIGLLSIWPSIIEII
ncbi:hypothetical protein CPB83DRAFT_819013 [Crepidotus variabilis]|uniref:Integral membrane protein n=1 Tax=Crepidotus variabilis TaxID=179855 RepID=A0A9P6JLV6_9AGAR|nr:hypothetical protein CPB83DRAFT_819013 [Crepidotus variabilis]